MKKLSILAAMFGVLFATASIAGMDAKKKDFKNMTPEQKAEWKEKKGDKVRAAKKDEKWESMTEEEKAEFKKHKEAKYAKCLESKSEEECKKMKVWKKDGKKGDCMKDKKASEAVAEEVDAEEAPKKKKWFFGLF
ncbi:MAG: hypothetical protein FWG80_04990 [Alphaproteobacteria bacterium]|nr:hypothetical protein [Alphaproteobacteria bacterium]